MKILVDSSVWIDYFKGGEGSESLDQFIEENLICINKLILAEVVPLLKIRKQKKLISLLNQIRQIPIEIDWDKIIAYRILCLQNGINKVGIPDLIIVDNVIQNNVALYTLDRHFELISKYVDLFVVP